MKFPYGYDPNATAGQAWFDEKTADLAARFFPTFCSHVKGDAAGQPYVLSDWQKEIVRNFFGWQRTRGGRNRRYRKLYLEVPRKNSKTTFAAGLALFAFLCDQEPGAEVYSAAADRGQAAICFDIATGMIEQNPTLAKRCKVYRSRVIEVPSTGSIYKALSAEAFTKHGLNAHGIIFDELHTQKTRELWDVLTTSTGSRRQPITVAITTAGVYDPESIAWEQHSYALDVAKRRVNDSTFFPVIYGAEPSDDWESEETWKKANPNWGTSVNAEDFHSEYKTAKRLPNRENAFKQLRLNIWTRTAQRWIGESQWAACRAGTPDLAGRKCWAGLDLSTVSDLSAFVLAFPIDGKIYVQPFGFLPEGTIEANQRYRNWLRDGFLIQTPGKTVDYDFLRAKILAIRERYDLQEIAYDPWNCKQLADQLSKHDGIKTIEFRQGFKSMSPATKEFERRIIESTLAHDGHPVLEWNVLNAAIEKDAAANQKMSKKGSAEKIDMAVACVMAVARASEAEAMEKSGSSFEERGLWVL